MIGWWVMPPPVNPAWSLRSYGVAVPRRKSRRAKGTVCLSRKFFHRRLGRRRCHLFVASPTVADALICDASEELSLPGVVCADK